MSETKTQKNGETENDAVTVEVTPEPSMSTRRQDPFDRFGLGELSQLPAWFGRHWPDRLFGEMSDVFDHIKVEEFVKDDKLVVRAEMPGVNPDEDIDVSVDRGRLSIRAKRESRSEETTDDSYRSEFRYGSFSRVVPLPDAAELDEIEASYTDGILEVTVPLDDDDESKARSITVSRT